MKHQTKNEILNGINVAIKNNTNFSKKSILQTNMLNFDAKDNSNSNKINNVALVPENTIVDMTYSIKNILNDKVDSINKLEKKLNEISYKEDTLFTNYNKLLNNYQLHDSLLVLSISNRKQNVYVTNKIIYENEKKDIVNLSDYRTDSLFKSNIKWAYARYFYLFNEN